MRDWFRFDTQVRSATWDDRGHWVLDTSAGEYSADLLITACGQLSTPKFPDIDGLDRFGGEVFHTAQWRSDVDLRGARVAVIGSGCSAAQVVPAIQPEVATLDVYQRTPTWTMPRGDFEYSERSKRLFRRWPALQRLDRKLVQGFMEVGAVAMTRRQWMLAPFKAVGRRRIRKAIKDPALADAVTPRDQYGCKRVMVTDEWYPTLAKPGVRLISGGVEHVTPTGVVGGRTIAEEWAETPKAYLGLSVPAFPNMFLLYGPNTNGGTGSIIFTIEAGMRHVLAALEELESTGGRRIEVRREVADDFHREVKEALAGTVWLGCGNWYLDANGHSPNQWPWTWGEYTRRTRRIERDAYVIASGRS